MDTHAGGIAEFRRRRHHARATGCSYGLLIRDGVGSSMAISIISANGVANVSALYRDPEPTAWAGGW